MSGGSFDYLYAQDDPASDLLAAMRGVLEFLAGEGVVGAREAAEETERWERPRRDRSEPIRDVWHAVEWWQSGDWGRERVDEALKAYREDPERGYALDVAATFGAIEHAPDLETARRIAREARKVFG